MKLSRGWNFPFYCTYVQFTKPINQHNILPSPFSRRRYAAYIIYQSYVQDTDQYFPALQKCLFMACNSRSTAHRSRFFINLFDISVVAILHVYGCMKKCYTYTRTLITADTMRSIGCSSSKIPEKTDTSLDKFLSNYQDVNDRVAIFYMIIHCIYNFVHRGICSYL